MERQSWPLPARSRVYREWRHAGVSAVTGNTRLTTAVTTTSPAGAYPITAALGTLAATNYTFTFVNGILTVNKAVLTVTANDASRPYGRPIPAFTSNNHGLRERRHAGVGGYGSA